MCWPFVEGPRLEGGIEVLERRAKYPGEPRRKRLNFVKSHSRGESDEWELIRATPSVGSSRECYRHEMTQQPQYYPPLEQHQPQPLHHPQPHHPPLGFHGPGPHQQFLEPHPEQYHEVAPGVRAIDYHDRPLEEFGHHRGGGGGDLSPNIIYREPRAYLPQNLQINLGQAHQRGESRGRQPRRAESVSTYTDDTYTTDCSGYGYGKKKSKRAKSRYSDTEDTALDYGRPLRYYPRKRSRSHGGYYG